MAPKNKTSLPVPIGWEGARFARNRDITEEDIEKVIQSNNRTLIMALLKNEKINKKIISEIVERTNFYKEALELFGKKIPNIVKPEYLMEEIKKPKIDDSKINVLFKYIDSTEIINNFSFQTNPSIVRVLLKFGHNTELFKAKSQEMVSEIIRKKEQIEKKAITLFMIGCEESVEMLIDSGLITQNAFQWIVKNSKILYSGGNKIKNFILSESTPKEMILAYLKEENDEEIMQKLIKSKKISSNDVMIIAGKDSIAYLNACLAAGDSATKEEHDAIRTFSSSKDKNIRKKIAMSLNTPPDVLEHIVTRGQFPHAKRAAAFNPQTSEEVFLNFLSTTKSCYKTGGYETENNEEAKEEAKEPCWNHHCFLRPNMSLSGIEKACHILSSQDIARNNYKFNTELLKKNDPIETKAFEIMQKRFEKGEITAISWAINEALTTDEELIASLKKNEALLQHVIRRMKNFTDKKTKIADTKTIFLVLKHFRSYLSEEEMRSIVVSEVFHTEKSEKWTEGVALFFEAEWISDDLKMIFIEKGIINAKKVLESKFKSNEEALVSLIKRGEDIQVKIEWYSDEIIQKYESIIAKNKHTPSEILREIIVRGDVLYSARAVQTLIEREDNIPKDEIDVFRAKYSIAVNNALSAKTKTNHSTMMSTEKEQPRESDNRKNQREVFLNLLLKINTLTNEAEEALANVDTVDDLNDMLWHAVSTDNVKLAKAIIEKEDKNGNIFKLDPPFVLRNAIIQHKDEMAYLLARAGIIESFTDYDALNPSSIITQIIRERKSVELHKKNKIESTEATTEDNLDTDNNKPAAEDMFENNFETYFSEPKEEQIKFYEEGSFFTKGKIIQVDMSDKIFFEQYSAEKIQKGFDIANKVSTGPAFLIAALLTKISNEDFYFLLRLTRSSDCFFLSLSELIFNEEKQYKSNDLLEIQQIIEALSELSLVSTTMICEIMYKIKEADRDNRKKLIKSMGMDSIDAFFNLFDRLMY